MIPNTSSLPRLAAMYAVLLLLAGISLPSSASAATQLYAAANDSAEIWRIDPVTGNLITKFALIPPVPAARPGLAFDGTELFYTDENRVGVQVYSTAGTLLRTLPKPAGNEAGSGLGASSGGLFLVDLEGVVTTINKQTGAIINSYTITDAELGLTFAGARGTLFVAIGDGTVVKEINPANGALVNTINVPDIFRGLAFSSSNGILYGTRAGTLWAVNPNTGALLAGYPVDINQGGNKIPKSGALAADEPVLEICGDGLVNATGETCDPPGSPQNNGATTCRADCTYCGDGELDTPEEQCDDGNGDDNDECRNDCTLPFCGDGVLDEGEQCDDGDKENGDGCDENCQNEPFCGDGILQAELGEQCEPPNVPGCDANCQTTEICTDLVDNDGDGEVDCLDDDCDCLPIGRDPGAIRFGRPGDGDQFAVHGSLDPNTPFSPTIEKISFLVTNVHGIVYKLEIPAGDVKQIGRNLFRFRNKLAQRNRDGLARFDLRYFPRKDQFTFVVKSYGDLSLATEANMGVQLVIGNDAFLNQSTWLRMPKGWLLTLPGE